MTKKPNIQEYLDLLGEVPEFLNKYLDLKILKRLKKVGYFCGMDYGSKNIYDFKYEISRYDHSLSTALITWRFTKDKKQTIAALFHDISTPCFSHVIDYMNKDYQNQESTEEMTDVILNNSRTLKKLLKEDNITLEDITNFKQFTIVDNKRPKLCADRIDGIILTSLGWTKKLSMTNVSNIVNNIEVQTNEDEELELGLKNREVAELLCELNKDIDVLCHSNEDNYMMELLAEITKYAIDNNYINYNDLYVYNEEKLFKLLNSINDTALKIMLNLFKTVTLEEVTIRDLPGVKKRNINPLVNGIRFISK